MEASDPVGEIASALLELAGQSNGSWHHDHPHMHDRQAGWLAAGSSMRTGEGVGIGDDTLGRGRGADAEAAALQRVRVSSGIRSLKRVNGQCLGRVNGTARLSLSEGQPAGRSEKRAGGLALGWARYEWSSASVLSTVLLR